MQVKCIKAFGYFRPAHTDDEGNEVPADVVEVPDGGAVDPEHWEPVGGWPQDDPPKTDGQDDPPKTPPAPPVPPPAFPVPAAVTPTEGM